MFTKFPTARPSQSWPWIAHRGLPPGLVLFARDTVFTSGPLGFEPPYGFVWSHPDTPHRFTIEPGWHDRLVKIVDHEPHAVHKFALYPDVDLTRDNIGELQYESILYAQRATNVLDQKAAITALHLVYQTGLPESVQDAVVEMLDGVSV